jgi:hypothetical protein
MGSLLDLAKGLNSNSLVLELVKRFFYQFLGLYVPAIVLFIYFLLFWNDNVDRLLDLIPLTIKDDDILYGLFFVLATIITGEAINNFTSRLSIISPIKLNIRRKFRFICNGKPTPRYWSNRIEWPVWLNVAPFPVNFAQFDRYYLTALDEDKKVLAAKIGWSAFYRNLVFALCIIAAFHMAQIQLLEEDEHVATCPDTTCDYMTFLYMVLLIPAFWLGYLAQIRVNKDILWNAYKRNKLKNLLDAKYGDLSLSLGIRNEYKNNAMNYIVDRWFLATDRALRDISSSLLTQAERKYKAKKEKENPGKKKEEAHSFDTHTGKQSRTINFSELFGKDIKINPLHRSKDHAREMLITCYHDWYKGLYENVMDLVLHILDDELDDPLEERDWKRIRGKYNIAFSLYNDEVYKEIEMNVKKWGWVYGSASNSSFNDGDGRGNPNNQVATLYEIAANNHTNAPNNGKANRDKNSGNVHCSTLSTVVNAPLKREGDSSLGIVWESNDEQYKALAKVKQAIREQINARECRHTLREKQYFKNLDEIYVLYGGFEYSRAADLAQKLTEHIDSVIKNSTTENSILPNNQMGCP